MKITKTTEDNEITYFYDGVIKYEHYKTSNGIEWWSEYKDGKLIHYKDSNGYEGWSDDNPNNPKNFLKEEDVKPFEFDN